MMDKERQVEIARSLASEPSVTDVEEKEPMLYLWQVEAILGVFDD